MVCIYKDRQKLGSITMTMYGLTIMYHCWVVGSWSVNYSASIVFLMYSFGGRCIVGANRMIKVDASYLQIISYPSPGPLTITANSDLSGCVNRAYAF